MKRTIVACTLSFALIWSGLVALRWKLSRDEQRLADLSLERIMRQEQKAQGRNFSPSFREPV